MSLDDHIEESIFRGITSRDRLIAELEAVLLSAGIVRTSAGAYAAEYYVSEGKVMQLPIDEWIAARKQAAAKIAELAAIVARLPKYADTGEPTLSGDIGYIRNDEFTWLSDDPIGAWLDDDDNKILEITKVTVWNRAKDHYCLTIDGRDEYDYGDGPIYSTEAAALAAKNHIADAGKMVEGKP